MARLVRPAALFLILVCAIGAAGHVRAQDRPAVDAAADPGIAALLTALEHAVLTADGTAFVALHAPNADRERVRAFLLTGFAPNVTRAVVRERDRVPLRGAAAGTGYRVIVDLFAEHGSRAHVATWRLDVRRVGEAGADREWAIVEEEELSAVDNLYRLELATDRQFAAHNLKIAAEDLDVTLVDGSVFFADTDLGTTVLVLLGNGEFNFHPAPETEKGQVKIFCGADVLAAKFEAAYIRINPGDLDGLVNRSQLTSVPVDPRALRRAQDVFRDESPKSFQIDLADLSRDPWSLLPGPGDIVAELRTRRYATLTYARSGNEPEDISLFDRRRHKNISLYASKQKLARRGLFYDEDENAEYDVLHYDIELALSPERAWIDGLARLRIKVRSFQLATMTLRLADTLTVRSITSEEYGRLFAVRVRNQNAIVLNLPTVLTRDQQFTIMVAYSGRLEPQAADREAIALEQGRTGVEDIPVLIQAEPSYLYSNRNNWYPQPPAADYATARIQITIPSAYDCVASGQLEPGFPGLIVGREQGQNRKVYSFRAAQPLRYLAFIVSRFTRAETATVSFESQEQKLSLSVEANPRQVQRGRELVERAADIATFYEKIIGDLPYPSFTVALVESDLPGGHSPGYFAMLNQPLPNSGLTWRNDPAAFNGYPDFFIAHEVAHQWWGQAVGWRNYHEQWLSEGFAQYFAALYAQHRRGDELFASVLRQLRRWGMEESREGPIYLGYRLGHIRGDSKIFRALVYNKGAAVLHMLRRLIGDEAFFSGVRRFYTTERFQKAGTEDFRAAMEAESGRDLGNFFEQWIYGSSLPKVRVKYRVDGGDAVVTIEQLAEVFDLPITVTLEFTNRKPCDVIIPVTDRIVEYRIPLEGFTLRSLEPNKDDVTMVEYVKN